MRNIKLLIQYDGTNYAGWQIQPDQPSVQDEIQKCLSNILAQKIDLVGSGRTDSGVHATGQVAHFKSNCKLTNDQIVMALNSYLSKDIRILKSEDVPLDFHARFSAIRREYKYVIYNGKVCPPFIRNYVHFVHKPLEYKRLKESFKYLLGQHDFSSLCSVHDDADNKIRTLYSIESEEKENEITVWIQGNAFLRKMIRMTMGMLIEINIKGLAINEVDRVLKLKSRTAHRYPTAPPNGLFLNRVWYPQDSD